MSNSFFKKVPAITLAVVFAMLVGCQDVDHSELGGATGSLTTVSANASGAATDASDDAPPTASKPHLSRSAKKVEKLLREGKPRAAEKLLESYVPQFPDDGGLYAMKAQLLLLESDIVNDYTVPESRMHLITDACRTAVEFDPGLKPLVAEMLWRQVITDLRKAADEQTPIVFADWNILIQELVSEREAGNNSTVTFAQSMDMAALPMLALGIRMKLGHCMLAGGWATALHVANELDLDISMEWAKQLRGLSSKFADGELYASGMYVEFLRTYYEGTNQDERPTLLLKVLADQIDEIKSSARLKQRANLAINEFAEFAWKDEIVALAKQEPVDSKIRQLFEVLAK